MARPQKEGLEYFPFDVDFFEDEKVEAIAGEFGIKGEIALIKLLCAIYRNGYFIQWNDLLKMKLLKRLPGVSDELLELIVIRLVRWGFFNNDLFNSDKVLTSKGIQKRYSEAVRKRKNGEKYHYWLLTGVSSAGNPAAGEFLPPETPQIKLKEIKLKEIKEVIEDTGEPDPPLKKPEPESLEEKQKKCTEREKAFYASVHSFDELYTPEMLQKFYDYWREPNKAKTKMKFEMETTWDIKLRLIRWEQNNQKYKKNFNGTHKVDTSKVSGAIDYSKGI